jgi:hypothetical protein
VASRNSAGTISRVLLLAWLAVGCQPDLVVGTWSCPVGPRVENDAGMLDPVTEPVALPWSTDFEHGICDLYIAKGYCYDHEDSSYALVDTLARSGKHSVEFTIDTEVESGRHTRCVREGALPDDAYYGAWYYIPEQREGIVNWNLLHFQGGDDLHNLWDVSIEPDDASGKLKLYVLGKFSMGPVSQDEPPTLITTGAWFHIEFRWRRRSDATGRVSLYQDGKLIIDLPNLITDDTTWGQWYVGNLANSLTPATSTLYVDDISIRPAP